ncbi:ephrin type-A receptor 4-B-like isoform X2 [Oscarella lobularis]
MSACDAKFSGQCQVIFDLYTYQTLDANINTSFVNQSTFIQHRISAKQTDGITENKVTINLDITSEGLYVAFRDTGSCMGLNLVEVKSYVCPSIVTQLAQFPQTKSSTQTKIISGQCVPNAETNVAPQQFCQPGGLWNGMVSGGGCECLSGYEVQNASCRACQPGFFKDLKGNMNCSLCPGNSFSLTTGSLQCTCHSGFDRTEEDPLSSACTTFPSEPLNVNATPINSTAVLVSWSPPLSNGGHSDLMYRISVKESGTSFVMTSNTEVVVTGLSPFTTVEVVVSSVNGISLKRNLFLNGSSALVQMPEDRPSTPPENVAATATGNRVEVSWKPPSQRNGIITAYTMRYFINGSGSAETWDVDGAEESITRELSNGGDYLYQVRASTSVGAGVYSFPVSPSVQRVGNSNDCACTTYIIIASVAIVLVVVEALAGIITIAYLCKKKKTAEALKRESFDETKVRMSPAYESVPGTGKQTAECVHYSSAYGMTPAAVKTAENN